MTFTEFIRSCGVMPPDFIEPDKWVRCATESHPRKKNAAVKIAADGCIGWVQNFESGVETWHPDKAITFEIDHAAVARRRRLQAEELDRATASARAAYNASTPLLGMHDYLTAKGLSSMAFCGLRVDRYGWLVVPMYIDGQISSIQRIAPTGEKRFWPGARTKGASYILRRTGSTITLLCEGLATGMTLFASIPDSTVIVTFNSGNLAHLASSLKVRGLCAVCADNDKGTEARTGANPGLIAGRKAADMLGCGLAYPDCDNGTDFNDAMQEFLAAEIQDKLFDKGFKRTDSMMKKNAQAKIRSIVMPSVKFVAPK